MSHEFDPEMARIADAMTPTPDEICERLRDEAFGVLRPLLTEAISRIQQQLVTIERLSAALKEARQFVAIHGPGEAFPDVLAMIDTALGKGASNV